MLRDASLSIELDNHSTKTVTAEGWRHASLQLLPLNPAFEPIENETKVAADIVIIGEHILIIPDAGFAR